MLFFQPDESTAWLAPYAYTIVFLGFAFFLFRVFESWYASKFDRPLYRHYFVYKKLTAEQQSILEREFAFYPKLSRREKRQFQHRVVTFISEKKIHRKGWGRNQ
ncbi:MAG: hypothetical protein JKY22_06705 [Flavobacteriaceae bacterium]|nr:hypothetical protein [Flavobacteriaceae bacterium]